MNDSRGPERRSAGHPLQPISLDGDGRRARAPRPPEGQLVRLHQMLSKDEGGVTHLRYTVER